MSRLPRVPFANLARLPPRVIRIRIRSRQRLVLMMIAVFEDFGEH